MEYGLIGEKLGHSFSKEIHAKIAPYRYELKEIPRNGLDAFMRAKDFCAVNVTIPYKTAVIPYLDEVDARARAIGAVNTVVRRGDKLYGYNTDYAGMAYLLDLLGVDVTGKKVLILGTGGTSLTATALMRDRGAREILRVSRSTKDGCIDYACALRDHADACFLINTTPVGMYPDCAGTPVDLAAFPRLAGVLDVIYHPLNTRLILTARERGIPACGGLAMLVVQAVRASELFTGTPVPPEVTERVVKEITREKEHLILIGMPASGKSSVGASLAKRMGRPLIDLDEKITEAAGMSVPEIFKRDGEAGFRDLESKVLAEVAYGATGAVISTGGGTPLREENRRVLRQTGRVFWLDRSPENLTPTADRPTASTAEQMRARYRERYDIYRAVCDCRIDADGEIADVAAHVWEEFFK